MSKVSTQPPAAPPMPAVPSILRLWSTATPASLHTGEAVDEDRAIASGGMALLARMVLVRFALGAIILILAATLLILR
jgi:hypothetical protein